MSALSSAGPQRGWTYKGDCYIFSYPFHSIAQPFPSPWPWPREHENSRAKRVYSNVDSDPWRTPGSHSETVEVDLGRTHPLSPLVMFTDVPAAPAHEAGRITWDSRLGSQTQHILDREHEKGLQLSHTQPQPPVHTVGIPRPGWPGCSNSSEYVVPQSGSRGDSPICKDPEASVSQRAERYQGLRSWDRLWGLRGGGPVG